MKFYYALFAVVFAEGLDDLLRYQVLMYYFIRKSKSTTPPSIAASSPIG